MSDDEDFMGDGGDDFDDGFSDDNFSNEDAGSGAESEEKSAEEWYYEGKSLQEEKADEAKDAYLHVIEQDENNTSEYGFKAHKRIILMMIRKEVSFDEAEVKSHFNSTISYVEFNMKTMEKILDALAGSMMWNLLLEFMDEGASAFLKRKNERSWYRTYLNGLKHFVDAEAESNLSPEQSRLLSARIEELQMRCELAPGVVNPKKESFFLEVIALRMKRILLSVRPDRPISMMITGINGLRRLVYRIIKIQFELLGLTTLGTINECSGLVMLYDHKWSDAKQRFFEAFKNYDDSASPRRWSCLRYFVLSSLMENSGINPFETREIKPQTNHEEILPFVALWTAFENRNVSDFNTAVQKAFENDDFGRLIVPSLVFSFQCLKVAEVVKAYSKVRLSYIAQQLELSDDVCNTLITELILDGRLVGSIDQVNKVLYLEESGLSEDDMKYQAMSQWSKHVEVIASSISGKVINTRENRGFRDMYDGY